MPSRRIPDPLSLVLSTLRISQGWSQQELGKAAGLPTGVISDLERGRRTLTRPKLDELAATLGYPPEAIDILLYAVGFLRGPEPPPGRPLSPTPAEVEHIEWSAALVARLTADASRLEMTKGLLDEGIRQDRARAEKLWERLKPHTHPKRRVMVEKGRELQNWALCERLCAESERAAAADAGRALELADLALQVAIRVPGPQGWVSRIQGYAWAFVGNARRVASDLPGADKAFRKAWQLWGACSFEEKGPLQEWRLLDLEASLRRAQRRLPEALVLIDRALASQAGDSPPRILLKKAFILEQVGDHKSAIETLQKAAPLVEGQTEPRLLFALRFNLAVNLCQLNRHAEAAALLPEVRLLALRLENGPDQVRTLWLEGRIAAGLGRRDEAISALARVRSEFAARGLMYDAALSTLELAVLYLEEGRTGQVKEMARQMAPIFQSQGVHREALAALRLFRDAAEREAATAELARNVAEYLCRARHDPGLKFQGTAPNENEHL